VFCGGQKAENDFSALINNLKHRFLDLVHFAFLDAQKAENEFVWPIETLKHRFIDYTQVAFCANHKTAMNIQGESTP
jgi:hypothetical protein